MERSSSVGTTPGEFEFPCTQHEEIDFEGEEEEEEEEEGCSEEEPPVLPVLLRLRYRDPQVGKPAVEITSTFLTEPGCFDFPAGNFNVGSDPTNALVMANPSISSLHAVIEVSAAGSLSVTDFSVNGTANSMRTPTKRLPRGLKEKVPFGAVLWLGPTRFFVEEINPAPGVQGDSCKPSSPDEGGNKRPRGIDQPLSAPRGGMTNSSVRRKRKRARKDDETEDLLAKIEEVSNERDSLQLRLKQQQQRGRVADNRRRQVEAAGRRANPDVEDTAKQPICRDFNRGRCTRGDKCRFRHERDGKSPKPNAYANRRESHRGFRRSRD